MIPFWSAHTHSKFSVNDALPTVEAIVTRAAELEYPALGLTDHGNMAGTVQLYKQCRKVGIKPLPGMEAYVTFDRVKYSGKRPKTFHMGLLATNEVGYTNLVGLTTMAHKNFYHKPTLDFADFAALAQDGLLDGVAAMTGCWFGLAPTLLREGDQRSVMNIVKALDGWFGSGAYIELQNHNVNEGIQSDEDNVAFLHRVAVVAGLPAILTQDSHYVSVNDREAHDTLKLLSSWSEGEESIFPGDGYHMVDSLWMKDYFTPEIYDYGMAGLTDLASKANVVIPALDNFTLKVPDTTTTGDPDTELTARVCEKYFAMCGDDLIPASRLREYSDRIDEELDVVIGAGFSGYLMFSAHVTDYLRKNEIEFGIRGSASGSILCWLLDISSLDPIAWGLSFERFITRDRAKPPDIDIDVEHERRQEIVDWLLDSYLTVNISTWSEMKMTVDAGEPKGTLVRKFRTRQRNTDPSELGSPIPQEELAKLEALAQFEPLSGYGCHAAGLMIAPDEDSLAQIPLLYIASDDKLVTAYDKNDVESMGMVKLDVLGLKTFTALKNMAAWSGVDQSSIPVTDAATYAAMRKGKVVGAFQLDGGASIRGIKQLKPTKITDVIAAMALFRPATMNSGATEDYIARRNKTQPVPVRHSIIMEETKDTYGVILYQEQALEVMKRLGLSVDEIEKARKAIKASNADIGGARGVMNDLIGKIKERATDLSPEDLSWVEDALSAYAGYGFNKSHATSYGLLAYITTWFSVHHPVEFWTAMLDAYAGEDKEITYLNAARAAGVIITGAHVNKSKKSFVADVPNNTIRKGLISIKGIGEKAAEELALKAPYESLFDLAERVNARVVTGAKSLRSGHSLESCGGVINTLSLAGALEGIK